MGTENSYAYWLGVFEQTIVNLIMSKPKLIDDRAIKILFEMIEEKECEIKGIKGLRAEILNKLESINA